MDVDVVADLKTEQVEPLLTPRRRNGREATIAPPRSVTAAACASPISSPLLGLIAESRQWMIDIATLDRYTQGSGSK